LSGRSRTFAYSDGALLVLVVLSLVVAGAYAYARILAYLAGLIDGALGAMLAP
jgi:hypothetical protein